MNVALRPFVARKDGAILIAGERAVCDQRGVLHFPDFGLLVVSDLHLEKGSSLARRGVLLPPYDTAATLMRLQAIIADYNPQMVISLGDSFPSDLHRGVEGGTGFAR